MVANENVCIGPLIGSLCLYQSVPGREKPYHFSQLDVNWVFFRLWCWMLGSSAWGLDRTLLSEIPLAAEIFLHHFSCHPWEPSQPSHMSSALCTSHFVVKLFLLCVRGYKASLPLLCGCIFWVISLQFIYNSRFVLGGG